MKLHLNLALRRAVLAAMATMAVYTTQADETTSFPGGISNGQYLVTGTTITSASYNSETVNYTPDIFIGGGKEGNADLTLIDGASITANSVNVGNSHNAITGTLTVGAAPETDTEIPTTPETDTETSAPKASVTTNQLNVGCYAGQGTLVINKDGEVTVSGNGSNEFDSSLNLGYHTTATTNQDTITIAGGTLTVGSSDIKNAKVSIGALNSHASMEIKDGGSATFYGQTIVGENGQTYGTIEVKDGATLNMEGNTVVGLTSSAYGTIIGEGTVDEKGDYDTSILAGNMTVGDKGNGSIELYNAQLTADAIAVAKQAGSYGEIFVGSAYDDGAPVTTTKTIGKLTTELLSIGQAGEGVVTIADGSSLSATDITLGYASTGDGTLSIGKNAIIGDITNLVVGYEGKGTLTTASSLKTKALHVRGKDSTATISDKAVLTTGNLTIVNGGYLDVTGTATVEGDTLLDNSSSINVSGILTTNGTTEEGANGSTVIGGTITIEKGGTWNANGSTAGFGTIANDGKLNVGGTMAALQGITGTGDIEVAEGSSLTLAGATTQGDIKGNGSLNVYGTVSANSLSSSIAKNTTLYITSSTASGSIITLENAIAIDTTEGATTSGIKAEFDFSDTPELYVGKTITFVQMGEIQAGTSITKGLTDDDLKNGFKTFDEKTQLSFTATGDSTNGYTSIVFNKLSAIETKKVEELSDNVTIELEVVTETVLAVAETLEAKGVKVVAPETEDEKAAATSVEVENDTILHSAELSQGVDETENEIRTNVVIGKDVESSGSGSTKVQNVVVNQKTTFGEGTGATTKKETIGVSGVALVLDGKTDHTGNGAGSELGFNENTKEGTLITQDITSNVTTKNEVKKIDIVQVEQDSDVTVTNMSMHSTHALTIAEGTTITFKGVDLHVGGTTDVNLTKEVEVKVYDETGQWTGETKTEVVDSGAHLTVDSTITKATVKVEGNSVVKFEKIDDSDHHSFGSTIFKESAVEIEGGSTLGDNSILVGKDETHMQTIKFDEKSQVTNHGNVKNAEFHNGSELKNNGGEVEDVVISNGSHLTGKGNLKKVHVDKDSYFTVGSSPGKFSAEQLTVDGKTSFYIITDSKDWDGYTGDSSQITADERKDGAVTGDWGGISQLVVDGSVTLNGQVTFIYQHYDAATGEFVTEDTATARKKMKQYFKEGSSIKFVDFGQNGNLTLGSGFSVDLASLPELEDGLFWDVNSLFTESTVFVISEILEEPVRVANSMVSAGDTVLDFGRVAEAQAILRKAGTTRVWGSALGSFDSVDSDGALTGYDYNSWGGAVGVDHAFTSRTVLGVAFGCTWGENEPENGTDFYDGGSIDQDARMIGIYGTHKFRTKGLMNDVKLSAFAAYGMFENDSTRNGLKNGHNATAEWDSDAWVLSASLSRDITTDSGVVFTPYVGVEYTKAGMDDFTEKGKSYNATYTADEDYSNLTVKVGVSVSKTIGSFTPYAGISYICDVARDTPKVTASGKRTITGEASMPGRHALRLNVGTGVKLSDSWDAYAGYSAELRDKATEHNVNVGVGYTF